MARVVRCALVQMGSDLPMDRPVEEIKAALNDKCARLIAGAASGGVQVLALPELFNTPYFAAATDPRWYAAAEPVPDGPTTALMRELARRHGMVIVAPFYEQAGAARYNSAAVIDADGRFLGVYRKHHVPIPHAGNYEPFFFHRPDIGFPVFDTAYGRMGVYICYDRHFPEIARIYGVKGAEVVFNPSATGGRRSELVWELEQQAHALANGYFVGALNRVGRGRPYDSAAFFGKSYFCNPLGELIVQAGRGVEEVLIADLDLDEIQSSRESWHTNRLYLDRRPATYHEMFAEGIPTPETRKGESTVAHRQRSIHYVPIMTDEMKAAAVRALEDGRLIRSYLEKDSEGGRFEDEFCAYLGA
jgi:beta-ureidopropionase